ncbi:MAG: amidohydrolase family protein [Pseudomonadales bacterium]|nr:amidohydrolase family protein [Pseudomonadales bacterium]
MEPTDSVRLDVRDAMTVSRSEQWRKYKMDFDIIIRGGTIVDGLNTPAYQANIAITDGKIVSIGQVSGTAIKEINAIGKTVTPGFIDMHTHMDGQLFWDGMATPSTYHGITSVMIANCGFALTPIQPESKDWVIKMLSRVEGIPEPSLREGLDITWQTYPEYLDALDSLGLGLNVGAMVPHSNIRYDVMGEASRERVATAEEVASMLVIFEECMQAGGFGLSSSWNSGHADADGVPVPSRFADKEELISFAKALRKYPVSGIEFTPQGLMSGLTTEDFQLIGDMSRAAGGKPVNWNALLDVYGKPGIWRKELDWMEEQNAKGAQIYAINSCFSIDADICFATAGNLLDDRPNWSRVLALPYDEKVAALSDPSERVKLKKDFESDGLFSAVWVDVKVNAVSKPENEHYLGKNLIQIAEEKGGIDPIDAWIEVALEDDLKTEFFRRALQNQDEDVIEKIIQHELSIPGVSDGGAHLEYLCQYGWPIKLLSYWVKEKAAMTLEEAVWRCTTFPAEIVGLKDRGSLQVGRPADVIVFDYAELGLDDVSWASDIPGGQRRKVHYPKGMECVIVNGEVTIEHGVATGRRPGKVIRSTDYYDSVSHDAEITKSESEVVA